MKPCMSLMFLLTLTTALSQENRDYIIRLNKDTVFTGIARLDKKMKYVVCEEKQKRIKYAARDLLALKFDSSVYETGLIRLKRLRPRHYVLLRRTLQGKLNLYELPVKKTQFLWKSFGGDLIHGRLIYRAHDWRKSSLVPAYFYKKESESRARFSRSWKEKTRDCQLFCDTIKAKPKQTVTPEALVRFYNLSCN